MKTREELNKALVLEAFDALFNKRDYKAAERFWSPNYIQHSAHIAPGRNGLFDLIKATPPSLRYEHALVVVDGDLVVLHGRFSGLGLPVNWIAVDIVRVQAVCWLNTGTSFRTRPHGNNPRADIPCSAPAFPTNLTRSGCPSGRWGADVRTIGLQQSV
jgi:predicted SnoaL-like aldol condensation-catalyzing enzyme